jgi:hypothetical protein
MTTKEMLDLLKQRTKIQDPTKLLLELRAGYRWAVNKIYKSADGPAMLVTIGEELTALVATTRDYNIESHISGGNLLGMKQLWVKMPGDTGFTPMIPLDADDPQFQALDDQPAASPRVASGHPVFYAMLNFGSTRFAPALPTGSILRVDYARIGPVPDPTTNPTTENGVDIPALFHDGVVNKATAHLYNTLDDDREGSWETRAMDCLNDAIHAAGKGVRTQAPVRTKPFLAGRRRR